MQDSWDYFSSLAMSPLAKETGQTLVPGYVVSDDPTFVQVGDAAVLKGCVCMKLIHPACCKVGLWMLYKQTNKQMPTKLIFFWWMFCWNIYFYVLLCVCLQVWWGCESLVLKVGCFRLLLYLVLQNPLYENIVFNFRLLTADELKKLKFPYK